MKFDIITIFPKIFDSYFNESILKRAQEKKLIKIKAHDLRKFSKDKHRKVDDKPYGGGAGMVLMAEPILNAVQSLKLKPGDKKTKIIIFSPKGKEFNQKIAYNLAEKYDRLIFITGRYEGIDERVKTILKAEEISIGRYVLTDGDVAAMAVVSAVTRLIPGAIKMKSLEEESHWNLLLKKEEEVLGDMGVEYPHYTRPELFKYKNRTYRVPKVLLSGDHKKIEEWRKR